MPRDQVECFISPFVIQEIASGDKKAANRRLELVRSFQLLEINSEIQKLAQRYFDALNIPEKAKLDASHLAVAV